MSTKFTPGPWSGGKEVFLRTVELESVGLSLLFGSFRTEEAKANAHLIAAAPELYAALETARDYVASELHLERQKFEGYEQASDIASIEADIATIDAALAKARGES